MTEPHKNQILKCRDAFVKYMTVDVIVFRLIYAHLLNPEESEDIMKHKKKAKQAKALLDVVIGKPDRAFDKLFEALQSSKQGRLANLLLGKGKRFSARLYSTLNYYI